MDGVRELGRCDALGDAPLGKHRDAVGDGAGEGQVVGDDDLRGAAGVADVEACSTGASCGCAWVGAMRSNTLANASGIGSLAASVAGVKPLRFGNRGLAVSYLAVAALYERRARRSQTAATVRIRTRPVDRER